MGKLIEKCPSCGTDMSIKTLVCKNCGIEINCDFNIPKGNSLNLNEDEIDFLKVFMKYEGNISKAQEELGLGYTSVKAKIKAINIKLGNNEEMGMDDFKDNVDETNKGLASQRIIGLLKAQGGVADCPMLRGEPIKIWLTDDGVKNSGYPDLLCTWDMFDAIVNKAKELGGIMYRGDSAAQSGAKIGSKKFPVDTMDAFISMEFYGKQEGESTTRRSTYFAAILAWAAICNNRRSDGNGGYIELLPRWME